MQEVGSEWRETPKGVLYLERVEAAGMDAIVKAIQDDNQTRAVWVVELLERLSIV